MIPDKKIKILICIPTLECGGSEHYIALLCKYLSKDRFTLVLVVLNNEQQFYPIENKEITILDLKTKRVRNALFPLLRVIKQEQPDIVFSAANHLNLLLAMFRWMLPKTIRLLARESSLVSVNSKRTPYPALYSRLIKRYFPKLDLILCQSVSMQQDLIQHYQIPLAKTRVISNPVETPDLKNGQVQNNKFITVARLSEEKGLERLIHSVALLQQPFQYYIIGSGDKKTALQEQINEKNMQGRIFLIDEKPDPFNGMEDAALFLMGSHYEGFPNVLLEAGALGIPVIAFDAPGGINEIILDGENGFIVKANDPQKFADTIQKAIHHPFDRESIHNKTLERFSVDSILPKLESLLNEIVS